MDMVHFALEPYAVVDVKLAAPTLIAYVRNVVGVVPTVCLVFGRAMQTSREVKVGRGHPLAVEVTARHRGAGDCLAQGP